MLGRVTLATVAVLSACLALSAAPAGAAPGIGATPSPVVDTDLPCTPSMGYPLNYLTRSVKLDHDVSCPWNVEWDIGPGVTVDLNGHSVTVSPPPAPPRHCATSEPFDPVCHFNVLGGTLKNGRLVGTDVFVGAGYPPHDNDPNHAGQGLATGLVLTGGATLSANSGLATNDVVIDGAVALTLFGSITHSWIVRSPFNMHNTNKALPRFNITDNIIVNSPSDGIGLNSYYSSPNDTSGQIERNIIIGSAANGVRITHDLDDLGAVSISHNLIVGSGGCGIELSGTARDAPGGPITIAGNIALFNKGHGIDAPWDPNKPSQVIDGGHNVAFFNHLRPQCIEVHC